MKAMSLNRLVLATLTVALASYSQAQWSQFTHPGYQSIFSVTTSPGAIHMVSYPNGVITSTNGGANWTPTSSGLPAGTEVEAVFYNGNVLLAGTHSGVYKSTNGGASWSLSNTGLPSSSSTNFARKFFKFGTTTFAVFKGPVGSNTGGVWRSTDDGTSWFSGNGGLSSNMTIYQLANVNARIWAATNAGLTSTSDLGLNWTSDAASNFACYAIQGDATRMVIISTFGYRYRTYSGGNWGAWQNATGAPANPSSGELILYDGKYWASTGASPSDVLRSTNNGQSWSSYATNIDALDQITQYGFHAGGTTLYLGTLTHLYGHSGTTTALEDGIVGESPVPYPTVFTDHFNVDLSGVQGNPIIIMLDASGREVARHTRLPRGVTSIGRGALNPGAYRVMLLADTKEPSLLGTVIAQ